MEQSPGARFSAPAAELAGPSSGARGAALGVGPTGYGGQHGWGAAAEPPPDVPPPEDPELRQRIEKLAEFTAKNGAQFEELMREKHQGNVQYAFLWAPGPGQAGDAAGVPGRGDVTGAAYYRRRLWLAQAAKQAADAVTSAAGPALADPSGVAAPPLAQPGPASKPGRSRWDKQPDAGGPPQDVPMAAAAAAAAAAGAGGLGEPGTAAAATGYAAAAQAFPGQDPAAAAAMQQYGAGVYPPDSQAQAAQGHAPYLDPSQQGAAYPAHGHYGAAPPGAYGPMVGYGAMDPYSLPAGLAAELAQVLEALNGTKEAIKGAKGWFMQHAPAYAYPLAVALRERMRALSSDADRQLHVVYLVNDILFHCLQQRPHPSEVDPICLALDPLLGSMLAAVYHNATSSAQQANRERLHKILEFWAAKEVFPRDTIGRLSHEMQSNWDPHQQPHAYGAATPQYMPHPQLQHPPAPYFHPGGMAPPMPPPAAAPYYGPPPGAAPHLAPVPPTGFSPALPVMPPMPVVDPGAGYVPAGPTVPAPEAAPPEEPEEPPYPLFPPGLIPGMVRKKQIGSGLPYAPLAMSDIPTSIPPNTFTESYLMKRVAKFFKTIGENDPFADDGDGGEKRPLDEEQDGEDDVAEGSLVPRGVGQKMQRPVHPGAIGALHRGGPSAVSEMDGGESAMGLGMGGGGLGFGGGGLGLGVHMEVDPETGMLPDGSVADKPGFKGSERLGLGASADPNAATQYDDVYTSYRKSISSKYHTAMSSRAAKKYEGTQGGAKK